MGGEKGSGKPGSIKYGQIKGKGRRGTASEVSTIHQLGGRKKREGLIANNWLTMLQGEGARSAEMPLCA